ncbi:rhomboid family intramembrane serine protease [Jannaschia aquimarina]|uniref:GlpG_2 protein n=1 Tax=Jannaschia aquimarina TaxID=935700 RepID=A0A0D1EH15_9RHOB|nr:rhomboid family intramembrane serine protease [Jannaschia aquimarina]KIT15140.1 Rhomboid protease GlpG [Jannaschia aquimarina]SNS65179.1 Rhomboid family protein [Jannaschia aquimarina]
MLGILRHGDAQHLTVNLLLIAIGGSRTERRIGSWKTLCLAALCGMAGTLVQYAVTGPYFVGASGIAYGLVCYALVAGASGWGRPILVAAIATTLILEAAFFWNDLSVAAHATAALIGGGFAMFGSLFASKEPRLRPMKTADIAHVVAIIDETDEDDAVEAEHGFLKGDLDGMFVLTRGSKVIGVTGHSADEHVPDIAWLSWTYLTEEETGEGLGRFMLNELLGYLREMGIRKLLIATSDYGENGEMVYAAAHRMYEAFGAEVEMTVPDYHARGEAKIVYGLENPDYQGGAEATSYDETGLVITGAAREPETDGAAGLIWKAGPDGIEGMARHLDEIRRNGARIAVLSIPSDISDANEEALLSHRFEKRGRISDYFAPELHQVWWTCSLR